MTKRKENWQGRNWCRPSTRLAIYLRDGLACVWCERGVEHEVVLTLDHVVPVQRGGGNDPGNLVTSCLTCNCARADRSVPAFARRFPDPDAVIRRVRSTRRREVPRAEARSILVRRPRLADAIEEAIRSVEEKFSRRGSQDQ